jgi:CubicO group peptidase (beta-lactamase class C family)
MAEGTLMPWLSSGKPLTAVAVAYCLDEHPDMEEGYETPVARVIPEFGVHGKEPITFRHLLTHTAGLRTGDRLITGDNWEAIVAAVCAARPEPNWEPGERAGYHVGASWVLLGEAVRRLSAKGLGDFVRERICLPLGMEDTWLGIDSGRAASYGARLGRMWQTENEPHGPHPFWGNPQTFALPRPWGGLLAPARDLLRFYAALLHPSGVSGWRPPLSWPEMARRQREGMEDKTFKHVVDFGYGFIVNSNRYGVETVPYGFGRRAGDNTFGHGGAQSSAGFADPDHGVAGAVVFNGMCSAEGHRVRIRDFLTALYEDLGF